MTRDPAQSPGRPLAMFTSRYRAVYDLGRRPGLGVSFRPAFVSVRTSLGTPRFMPESEGFPYVRQLAPAGLWGIDDRAEFARRYRARLDAIGVEAIYGKLAEVAGRFPGEPLALLCFEDVDAGQPCHRRLFAAWWLERTTQTIEERNTAGKLPIVSVKTEPAQKAQGGPSGQLWDETDAR
jgi:hypothetical protein